MIPRRRGVIALVYFILVTLCAVIRFPSHQLHSADKVVYTIANNEELYLLDLLTLGSISTMVDTVWRKRQFLSCRNGFRILLNMIIIIVFR